jgi:hypothetical protein
MYLYSPSRLTWWLPPESNDSSFIALF